MLIGTKYSVINVDYNPKTGLTLCNWVFDIFWIVINNSIDNIYGYNSSPGFGYVR